MMLQQLYNTGMLKQLLLQAPIAVVAALVASIPANSENFSRDVLLLLPAAQPPGSARMVGAQGSMTRHEHRQSICQGQQLVTFLPALSRGAGCSSSSNTHMVRYLYADAAGRWANMGCVR
jgi:hypothetical protein